MSKPAVRRQSEYVPLSKEQFRERFFAKFYDPVYEEVRPELEKVFEKAWDGYIVYRKSPRKKAAGPGYEVDFLDISTLADEPWKVIHPCAIVAHGDAAGPENLRRKRFLNRQGACALLFSKT